MQRVGRPRGAGASGSSRSTLPLSECRLRGLVLDRGVTGADQQRAVAADQQPAAAVPAAGGLDARRAGRRAAGSRGCWPSLSRQATTRTSCPPPARVAALAGVEPAGSCAKPRVDLQRHQAGLARHPHRGLGKPIRRRRPFLTRSSRAVSRSVTRNAPLPMGLTSQGCASPLASRVTRSDGTAARPRRWRAAATPGASAASAVAASRGEDAGGQGEEGGSHESPHGPTVRRVVGAARRTQNVWSGPGKVPPFTSAE